MGQKINANFFRISLHNNWDLNYIAKNTEESSIYLFTSINLKIYWIRFFKIYGLVILFCKTFISEISVKIIISFFVTLHTIRVITKKHKTNSKYLKKYPKKKFFYNQRVFLKLLPRKRIFQLRSQKFHYYKNKFEIKRKMILNSFSNKLMEVLKLNFSNATNVLVLLQKINKGKSLRFTNKESIIFRKIVLQLRFYFKLSYFKEMINILVITFKKKDSVRLLAEFLAFQFSIIKRHTSFLRFLKQSLKLLLQSNISGLKGLKIHFKGRINGVPRSSMKGMSFGSLPVNTLKLPIKYFKSTSYTLNGTLGIKVWLYENII